MVERGDRGVARRFRVWQKFVGAQVRDNRLQTLVLDVGAVVGFSPRNPSGWSSERGGNKSAVEHELLVPVC